ncbi:DUF6418 domain-containing protein [Acinetobacter sp. YH01024]|uniref:DUF6418 domain-containing protein n=1 Tax=Acinetobacter sp. YH01024 TaxID=2601037 RepID=UPI0015D3528C|nr:DUF6418 domain-containing protein [Acinetobacter sp. YH01024]
MITILFYFILFILIGLGSYFNENLIFSYTAILVFFSWIFFLYLKYRNFFISSIYMLYAVVSTVIVSLVLEYGVYLIEVNEVSYSLGLPYKAVFQVFTFLLGSFVVFNFLRKTNLSVVSLKNNNTQIIRYFFRALVVIFLIVIGFIIMRYGTPLQYGVHRNDYWTFYAPSWGSILTYWLMQFTFVFGYFYSKDKDKIDVILFLSILVCIFIMGERFTGLLYSLVFFSIPVLLNKTKIKFNLSFGKKVIFTSLGVIFISYALYSSFIKSQSSLNPLEQATLRASLQAQMWWSLDEITDNLPKDSNLILQKYLGLGTSDRESGVYYLMDQVASREIVDDRFESNSRFTMSGFLNNTYFFGYILGTAVNFFWGVIFGFLTYALYLGILSSNVLFVFAIYKLFFKVQAIILNGAIPDIFSFETLIFLMVMLFFFRFKSLK